jgi:hypothetical protein
MVPGALVGGLHGSSRCDLQHRSDTWCVAGLSGAPFVVCTLWGWGVLGWWCFCKVVWFMGPEEHADCLCWASGLLVGSAAAALLCASVGVPCIGACVFVMLESGTF